MTEPGYPESVAHPVRRCLRAVVWKGYLHRPFAERDLAVLEARSRDLPSWGGSVGCPSADRHEVGSVVGASVRSSSPLSSNQAPTGSCTICASTWGPA